MLAGFQHSQPIILELGPDINELKQEALALKTFAGFGAVKVIAEKEGMFLLERAIPGASLKTYFPEKDHAAINICCQCLKCLHKAPIVAVGLFSHIKDWLAVLDEGWQIPEKYLNRARQLRDNILQNGDDWIVIDPKGVIGDPAYDLAAFIRNPLPELLEFEITRTIIHQSISHFAEIFALSQQRIFDWCLVQAVLAWVWALEDGGDDDYFKRLTEFFNRFQTLI